VWSTALARGCFVIFLQGGLEALVDKMIPTDHSSHKCGWDCGDWNDLVGGNDGGREWDAVVIVEMEGPMYAN